MSPTTEARPAPVPPAAFVSLLPANLVVSPLRITSQAKMTALIAFALAHLADPTNPPLALHSLPPAPQPPLGPSTSTPVLSAPPPPAPDSLHSDAPPPPKASKTSSSSSLVLPKLVSVVEIVKRNVIAAASEAEKGLDAGEEVGVEEAGKKRKKGKGRAGASLGLHQYSRLGALEELGLAASRAAEGNDAVAQEQGRREKVAEDWIGSGGGGTKRPKRKHTPYMIVVLSHARVAGLSESGFTYQPPQTEPKAPPKRPTDPTATTEDGSEQPTQKKKRKRKSKAKPSVPGAEVAVAGVGAGEGADKMEVAETAS